MQINRKMAMKQKKKAKSDILKRNTKTWDIVNFKTNRWFKQMYTKIANYEVSDNLSKGQNLKD